MTALDLDAIMKHWSGNCVSGCDVPGLVAEVERLRTTLVEIQAMHHAKHGIYSHVDSGTGAHLGDEPYVICDYDKTPWPCRTQGVLDRRSSDTSEGERK